MTTETVAQEEISMIRAEVISSRRQLMNLTRDALEELVEEKRQEVKGGEWDGVPVITIPAWQEILEAVFTPKLPPPDVNAAEVETPAYVAVTTHCPSCGQSQLIAANLRAELVTDDDGSELKVKMKAKGVAHVCGQLSIFTAGHPDQDSIDESLAALAEDLRRLNLRAVAEVDDAYSNVVGTGLAAGPPPTLDAIAAHLGLVGDTLRGDLEDALYHLAESDVTPEGALVELDSGKGKGKHAPWYGLTEAGIAYLAAADAPADEAEDATEPDTDA